MPAQERGTRVANSDDVKAPDTHGCFTDAIIANVERHLPDNVMQWHRDDAIWSFSFFSSRLELMLSLGLDGKVVGQLIDTYLKIPRKTIDPLRTKTREALAPVNASEKQNVDADAAFVQVLELVSEFESNYKDEVLHPTRNGWDAEDIDLTWDKIVASPWGLNLSSVKDTAFHLLGKTPQQLCAEIPREFRVIHVESVLRNDFAQNFFLYQSQLEERAQNESVSSLRRKLPPHSSLQEKGLSGIRREDLIKDMITPRITYHGTPMRNVSSIVRNGFRMPGTRIGGKLIASPRSGIAFDRGIYSSQAPHYALSYASGQMQKTPLGDIPGMRLFVCASLMGRTFQERGYPKTGQVHGPLQDGFDAHFDGGFEYIVHDKRAMLPCYVIHLDLGAESAQAALKKAQEDPHAFAERQSKNNREHHKLQQKQLAPGDAKREKEMKKAAAMKWFPYGFGSASGTNFVIEEIGEISDDEEDYGEWQQDRHSYIKRRSSDLEYGDEDEEESWHDGEGYGHSDENRAGGFLDQYQHARYG